MYQIVGVLEKEEPVVQVRVKGTSKIFQKTAKELYNKKWLEGFSKEDAAYIGVLNAFGNIGGFRQVKEVVKRINFPARNVILLGMMFVCFLLIANVTAMKVSIITIPNFFSFSQDWVLTFPGALIFFPVTFIISDILTEVYGYKISRIIIWGGFICNAIFLMGLIAVVNVTSSPDWLNTQGHVAHSYEVLLKGYARVFMASSIAYFFGEFINSVIIAKLKVVTSGKYLYARIVGSTLVGAMIDSSIFILIVFYGVMNTNIIIGMIVTQIAFKLSYEIVMLPITTRIIHYLKKKDGVDHYDFDTKFNPFSFKN